LPQLRDQITNRLWIFRSFQNFPVEEFDPPVG
jgi:hypothetical protein